VIPIVPDQTRTPQTEWCKIAKTVDGRQMLCSLEYNNGDEEEDESYVVCFTIQTDVGRLDVKIHIADEAKGLQVVRGFDDAAAEGILQSMKSGPMGELI
jgi:hypothetical protein